MKDLNKKPNKAVEALIIALCVSLFFSLIIILYDAAGRNVFEHCVYDSYTLQAMAWRKGQAKLDGNYPYLELAVINEEWLSTHDKDDYMAYRETFGDVNVPIEDMEGNEYYVSFPPFPSVPMFILTFFFGENTPNTFMCILYVTFAFMFAILLCRRLGMGLPQSICGGLFVSVASSAFFLGCNYMAGGVWFQAQSLALLLTMAAFYHIHGKKKWENYWAFALLAFAVGCRPFQIVYFFYFAYVMAKKYNFRILKTWSYYISPALIGGCYMIYNYVRFGNPIEFGHNYLPEFMRMPAGQFGIEYLKTNLHDILTGKPEMVDGKLEFSQFGFTFYIANGIFMVLAFLAIVAIIVYIVRRIFIGKIFKIKEIFTKSRLPEIVLLVILMTAHFFSIVLHKTLGAWQFGSRYTVDIIPACLVCCVYLFNGINDRKIIGKRTDLCVKIALYILIGLILVRGSVMNICCTYSMLK